MNVVDLKGMKAAVKPGTRLLGIDLGEKTIGLALSDTSISIATPFETLARRKFSLDAAKIDAIIVKEGIGGLVIGLPLNMNGSEGPAAQSARAFARNFAGRSDLPVAFWDERLSTVAVTRTLLSADTSRKRRASLVDKMAAAFILQGAIDRMRHFDCR